MRSSPTQGVASANTAARGSAPMARRSLPAPEATNSVQTLCHSSQELIFARCSQSASLTHPRKLSVQSGLVLSQRNGRHQVRHLADPDNSEQLIAWSWQLDFYREVECASHQSFAETFTSSGTALRPSSPAAFWLRNQQTHLSCVGSAKTLGNVPFRASPAGASIAYPSRPLGTKHEREGRDPGGNARTS